MDRMINIKIDKIELLNILSLYLSKKYDKDVTVYIKLNIEKKHNKDIAIIKLYYIEERKEIPISDEEITDIIKEYVESINCELVLYRYLGGVRKKENNPRLKKDIPAFEGINICCIEKVKQKSR